MGGRSNPLPSADRGVPPARTTLWVTPGQPLPNPTFIKHTLELETLSLHSVLWHGVSVSMRCPRGLCGRMRLGLWQRKNAPSGLPKKRGHNGHRQHTHHHAQRGQRVDLVGRVGEKLFTPTNANTTPKPVLR